MQTNLSFVYVESSALSYQAAVEGQGFAMAQMALVQEDLGAGRLVRPFQGCMDKGDFTYYLVRGAPPCYATDAMFS